MTIQRYSVNQHPIQTLLTWINSGEIAIPEIQRPFVWNAAKVRDLIDSLYSGYPIGYLIAWRNPSVKLKDGSSSDGKRVLIDGQQRVTALMAALLGQRVIDKNYKRVTVTIAFHPQDRRFEVANPAIRKDKAWISNIADVLSPDVKMIGLVGEYCAKNEGTDQDDIYNSIELLRGIVNNHIGLIELNSELDIQTVTEIFIRINSQGAVLNQADFAMSKIAANELYNGNKLRKCIDYFCHLAVAPEFYQQLADLDQDFAKTPYFQKMSWLKNENDDLYDPSYTDMLRVAFTSEFKRGRLEDLVALLSGRNFKTREYEESIAEDSFKTLDKGIFNFMNETNFKRFVMILRSAGFVEASMIRSQNVINFAYIVYLVLRKNNVEQDKIESLVRRWFVMSMLTGRYSASPESAFDFDIRRIHENGIEPYLMDVEKAELSDSFWEAGLPQQMHTSVASSPFFKVFLASQAYCNNKGFLSKDITVRDLITHRGDVHHLFPRNYLKGFGLTRGKYNQIANYVMMQSEINIAIKDRAPNVYFSELAEQCQDGNSVYGGIVDTQDLQDNFTMHCIPAGMEDKDIDDYEDFLKQRRKLMALKIRDYYKML
ncbi:GmrSD restriction endonuclease domain-containing protein [Desulfogranum marinum]|uniref:GmrSD restriction endonuclease domain-containing protein n=1 Tax=Desulfogranum marinum TaxID=453220 RepID=UPI001965BCAC|nr:DUF262 domain-containing protein [Desulfogranum marinum]MBM9514998.1 DUF262 domain-containing protein [Desulfogranum marinum]